MDSGLGTEDAGHHDPPRALHELAPSVKAKMFRLLQLKIIFQIESLYSG